MTKTNKDKQCYTKHIEERQTIPWFLLLVLAMVLSDILRCVLNNIVFHCWFWSWYCLTFFDVLCIPLFVLVGFGHGIEFKHIEERQTIPWSNTTNTNNVIQNTWKNVRQYHGQNQQGQTMLCKYCLTFFDVFCITLFVLVGFGHGIVWRSSMCFVLHCLSLTFWPCYCLMFIQTHRRTSDNTMVKHNKHKQCYSKHMEERQTIPWPKPTRTNNVIGIVWRSLMCFV
jgi:hypothetical protein